MTTSFYPVVNSAKQTNRVINTNVDFMYSLRFSITLIRQIDEPMSKRYELVIWCRNHFFFSSPQSSSYGTPRASAISFLVGLPYLLLPVLPFITRVTHVRERPILRASSALLMRIRFFLSFSVNIMLIIN